MVVPGGDGGISWVSDDVDEACLREEFCEESEVGREGEVSEDDELRFFFVAIFESIFCGDFEVESDELVEVVTGME